MAALKRRILLLFLLAALAPLACAAPAPSLSLCFNREASFPWAAPGRVGLAERMALMVGKRLGIAVTLTAMPGPRCLLEVKARHYDGAVGVSYKDERRAFGRYPESVRGSVNPAKRLFSDQYVLVRRKGSNVIWDGKTVQPPNSHLAALAQVSIVDILRSQGLLVDDGTKTSEATLRKVLLQRADAAIILGSGASFELGRFPDLADKLEIAGPPVEERHYYLMLSYDVDEALAKRVWDASEQVRESAEYAAEQKAFLSGK